MPIEEAVKYVGSKKITEYNEIEGKVQFTLEDSSGDTVTREQFDSIAKTEPYEDGMVRVFKWSPAVAQIMEILLKNDLKLIEKDFVTGRIDATIIENYQQASAKLFGAPAEHYISLSAIHSVLTGKRIANSVESLSTEEVVEKTKTETETKTEEFSGETVGN